MKSAEVAKHFLFLVNYDEILTIIFQSIIVYVTYG